MKLIKTKKAYNIFSKRKEKPEKRIKLIIDYREKNSLVPFELMNKGFSLEFKELKVADYLVKDVAIERKTTSDFISSMINKRLIRQLQELQQYKKRILMIEGLEDSWLYEDGGKTNSNSIRGFIISILLNYNVPIIFTKNSKDTAKFISVLAKRKSNELSLRVKKKNLTKKEQLEFILEGFPKIGPKTAKKLLKKYKTLKAILNTPIEELKKDIGKNSEIFKKIIEEEY